MLSVFVEEASSLRTFFHFCGWKPQLRLVSVRLFLNPEFRAKNFGDSRHDNCRTDGGALFEHRPFINHLFHLNSPPNIFVIGPLFVNPGSSMDILDDRRPGDRSLLFVDAKWKLDADTLTRS